MGKTLEFFIPSNKTYKNGKPAPFDGMNELVNAERGGWGNAIKKRNGLHVQASCLYAMKAQGWECPDRKCLVTLTFVETSSKRDIDNIYGGSKFILDGISKPRGRKLYGAGAIHDDSQTWIELQFGKIQVDRENPGCWVRIEEIGDDVG